MYNTAATQRVALLLDIVIGVNCTYQQPHTRFASLSLVVSRKRCFGCGAALDLFLLPRCAHTLLNIAGIHRRAMLLQLGDMVKAGHPPGGFPTILLC
jgi:hypothetical protein